MRCLFEGFEITSRYLISHENQTTSNKEEKCIDYSCMCIGKICTYFFSNMGLRKTYKTIYQIQSYWVTKYNHISKLVDNFQIYRKVNLITFFLYSVLTKFCSHVYGCLV